MKRRDFLHRVVSVTTVGAAVPSILSPSASVRTRSLEVRSEQPIFEETPVYVSAEGYPSYRIPSLLATQDGTLLAFAEGRARHADHAQNDIVLRRSTDQGQSWAERQVVAEDGPHSLNNPQVVQESRTGRLMLMYQRYPEGCHSRCVVPGYGGGEGLPFLRDVQRGRRADVVGTKRGDPWGEAPGGGDQCGERAGGWY